MRGAPDIAILSADERPAAEAVNPEGRANAVLICDHASAAIPASLGDLGLAREDRFSHAVWDPGAEALSRALADALDAPLVLSRVSRLVHDCNRAPERADSTPARVERIEVPGNRGLSAKDRAARTREVYEPFHAVVDAVLDAHPGRPMLIAVHSFSPVWNGAPRAIEIGLLHDADDGLARAMLAAAPSAFRTELNMPYSAADGVTHSLARHGTARGLPSVMVEVRNDLLADDAGVAAVAEALTTMLAAMEDAGRAA
jgi:predicted N-formylglutamate amidohydrolase